MAKEANATAVKERAHPMQRDPAEFEYIGDDGGRWLFRRRSDDLCLTIDKPRGVVLTMTSPPMSVRLTVRGRSFRPEVLDMVRQ